MTILQSNFARAINQISRIVGSRATLPVLSNFLISAEKGRIKFAATDLEVGISTDVIGKIESEGSITLPARLVSDFVLNNKDEAISLKVEKNSAVLKSDRYEAKIQGISAEEFPTVPEPPKDVVAKISKTKLIDAFKKVVIAGATDETRPVLAGIYFQFNEETLTLAATDSYRLAEKKIDLEKSVTEKKVIVPLRTITETLRVISGEDGADEVIISAKDNQVAFQINKTYIVSRLIEGLFPNYTQIIPTKFAISAEVDLGEILSAVKMSSLFARDVANNNVKIKIKDSKLYITSSETQAGSASSAVEAKITGGDLEISFNARYLIDILNVVGGDKILLNFNDSTKAGAVKSATDKDFIYIIMPLKTE